MVLGNSSLLLDYPVPPVLSILPWMDFFEIVYIRRIFLYLFVTILNALSKQVSTLTTSPISNLLSPFTFVLPQCALKKAKVA